MIDTIKYIITKETDPYKNLPLEAYLLKHVQEQEVILYLWQNERTVVIGKNQNPWKECKIAELEGDGGRLVRRLSGGGAVFHDLGNLNFTFLATKENYNVDKQLEVIVRAVNGLGIPAMKSGRNDITAEGRKFSGNAFFSDGVHYYHHGTILVHVDMSMLSHYLNVSREKLVTKGVDSVRSRVTNLTEFMPELTIGRMKEELIKAFGEVYGLPAQEMNEAEFDSAEIAALEKKFSSWEWNLGRKMEFDYTLDQRFSWGDIELKLKVDSGKITDCIAYSDALETEFFEQLTEVLSGSRFSSQDMVNAVSGLTVEPEQSGMQEDIISLIREAKL